MLTHHNSEQSVSVNCYFIGVLLVVCQSEATVSRDTLESHLCSDALSRPRSHQKPVNKVAKCLCTKTMNSHCLIVFRCATGSVSVRSSCNCGYLRSSLPLLCLESSSQSSGTMHQSCNNILTHHNSEQSVSAYCYFTGVLLVVCQSEAAVTVDMVEAHLRSDALSRPRSEQEPENKAATRSYIKEQWGAVAENDLVEYKTSNTEALTALFDGEERVVFFSQNVTDEIGDTRYDGKNYVLIVKGQQWGSAEDRPILLGTHYDSVPGTPGKCNLAKLLNFLHIILCFRDSS